jgi:hypothetical protein
MLGTTGAKVSEIRAHKHTQTGSFSARYGKFPGTIGTVSVPMSTIYDVAHDYEYLAFGIMEKGDSSSICAEHDVIVHDASNS